ncbi:MAG: hypothetical protein GTO18_19185 [Anaerolineales bacterium]|nr:hypothetical protein [Anaerolineales bacterium]
MIVTLFVLLALFILLGGIWLFLPIAFGLPWVPAQRQRIRRALELAEVNPGERVYDLGSGDGRVLITAAKEFGAHAVGIEIEPVHCMVSWIWNVISGVEDRVSIRWGNFYSTSFNDADVLFIYVRPKQAEKLNSLLKEQLKPGSRVISISVDVDGWEPTAYDPEGLIFLYRMPPIPGSLETYLAKSIHYS